jgi:RsiW-degrading membrane proteinase PrsW (M82 family)
MLTTILTLILAPVAAIAAHWFYKSRLDAFSAQPLWQSFFVGILVIIPVAILDLVARDMGFTASGDVTVKMSYAIAIGFTKEWLKYLFLLWFIAQHPAFDEPYKGIAYALMMAFGFAAAENVIDSLFFNKMQLMSPFLSLPVYTLSAILMGYGLGQSKNFGTIWLAEIKGLLLAFAFHAACLFSVVCQFDSLLQLSAVTALVFTLSKIFKATKIRQRTLAFQAYARNV